jgi:hypothetical protein
MVGITPKRDNKYFLDRLAAEQPHVYADYLAGKFKNISAAVVAGGLRKAPSGLDALNSAWARATPAERDAFQMQIECIKPSIDQEAGPTATATIVSNAGTISLKNKTYLTSSQEEAVRGIMARRKMRNGDVMRELGFTALDASLARALFRGSSLREEMLTALDAWITRNQLAPK